MPSWSASKHPNVRRSVEPSAFPGFDTADLKEAKALLDELT
jgi:hypothetical protein